MIFVGVGYGLPGAYPAYVQYDPDGVAVSRLFSTVMFPIGEKSPSSDTLLEQPPPTSLIGGSQCSVLWRSRTGLAWFPLVRNALLWVSLPGHAFDPCAQVFSAVQAPSQCRLMPAPLTSEFRMVQLWYPSAAPTQSPPSISLLSIVTEQVLHSSATPTVPTRLLRMVTFAAWT